MDFTASSIDTTAYTFPSPMADPTRKHSTLDTLHVEKQGDRWFAYIQGRVPTQEDLEDRRPWTTIDYGRALRKRRARNRAERRDNDIQLSA